jgi:putative glycosyltransferase (TIGR04348 family)
MRAAIVTPAKAGSRHGNRVTALRWARILKELGHEVRITRRYDGGDIDLLVALHARRSATSIRRFRERFPDRPLVLALTGTDLYHDIRTSHEARDSLHLATRMILLQPDGLKELPEDLRSRSRVIYQSAELPKGFPGPRPSWSHVRPQDKSFTVCVLGHLRTVKDPFRTAMAVRRLPPTSGIRVIQVGAAMSLGIAHRAEREMATKPRYEWVGSLTRSQALRVLANSDLLCLTSLMEGGANVISEAVALGVPVVASHISGSVGLLGEAYPGYYPPGDTRALRALLLRAEVDTSFYGKLREWCRGLQTLFTPAREQESWRLLLEGMA